MGFMESEQDNFIVLLDYIKLKSVQEGNAVFSNIWELEFISEAYQNNLYSFSLHDK